MAILAFLAAGLVFFAFVVRTALVPFVLAAVFALIFEPPVRFLESRRVPRLAAIVLVYLVAFGLVVLFLIGLVPVFIRQLTLLAETLPALAAQVRDVILELQARYSEVGLPEDLRELIDNAIRRAQMNLIAFIEAVLAGLFNALSGVLTLLLAPFLAFYLIRDRDVIRNGVATLLPVSSRGETLRALSEMNQVLAGYIRGQLLVAAIVGSLVGIAAQILGLPFSAILGVVAGVTNVIPYFGPIIGAVPAVGLALLESPLLALKTIAAFFVIQQIDSLFVTPRILGVSVGLHPLVVIFSLLAGLNLYGILGMLVAVPAVAVGKVLSKHLFERFVAEWRRAGTG
ncbi:MAG: AI-2E family transporter [Bacillota bacterium]|nr:MAG: AI-2E family transporter [Bacillota bacterium]